MTHTREDLGERQLEGRTVRAGVLHAARRELAIEDGLEIVPGPLRGTVFETYADHRMVMAGALLALRAPGTVIEDPATVGKTLPQFVHLWDGMLEATEG